MPTATKTETLHMAIKRHMETQTDPLVITLAVLNEIGNDVQALQSALRTTLPEYVRSVQRGDKNRRIPPPAPIYSPPAPATGMHHSPKLKNIRGFDWNTWRADIMSRQLFTGSGARKRYAECTAVDFEFAANQNTIVIEKNEAARKENLALAALIRQSRKRTLSEVPPKALKAVLDQFA